MCIFLIFALAACYAANAEPSQSEVDASLADKKTEKRGIYGFGYGHGIGIGGYGGYYGHGHSIGYPHYGGYAAVHHGYAAPYYGGHGFYPNYHHGFYH